ncbi:Collagen-like protein [Orpheovirus IHUMI-LCC2]|uniref:Collagen-like protein n=1 Tax=Orpheovirus IHUMI-LCC2 TaxID=2023057 RepID=A0A2I2L3G6_9VIRU|nr:Collagen-like protein [Orpheovirus IHUMI-LCC2]SNW62082.1 Collagen-like protein [Orpheovirus IHUMI-LCC2]
MKRNCCVTNCNPIIIGPQGQAGCVNIIIITGNGIPGGSIGNNGDLYIDNLTGNYYQKENGIWVYKGNLRGPPGVQGPKGEDGSQILTGIGLPSNFEGQNGDFYLDNFTGNYYQKKNGIWILKGSLLGPQGPQGPSGMDGSQIITNNGPPDPLDGRNGDFYLDNTTGNYYQKENGIWIPKGNLMGPQGLPGINGSQIITGNGNPITNEGQNGDLYIDNLTGNYYQKENGIWIIKGNLIGPQGSQIITNSGPPLSSEGQDGDFYLDNLTGNYYQKENGIWMSKGSLLGPQGPQGSSGMDGSQIITNNGPPSSLEGQDGDFYLDNTTGNYYQKENGIWIPKGNLMGPQGLPGTDGSQIITGNGNPIPNQGENGDFYLDNLTGNYYQKENGIWIYRGNLMGPQGPPGVPGQDGSQILTGNGLPSNLDGKDGDFYLDNLTGNYYQKENGIWIPKGSLLGPQGLPGVPGENGSQIITGNGNPSNSQGQNGDFYLDNITGNYYQKVNGIWIPKGNLKGPPGSQIITGNGVPDVGEGSNGDFYLDNITGNYYQKENGVWIPKGNLIGPQGIPGQDGSQILTGIGLPSNFEGQNGDFYLDNFTGNYYQKVNGIWIPKGNLMGPQGLQGLPGKDGSQIITGNGTPSSMQGQDGDFYLDNTTGDYYQKQNGVWMPKGNLVGPQGPPGDTIVPVVRTAYVDAKFSGTIGVPQVESFIRPFASITSALSAISIFRSNISERWELYVRPSIYNENIVTIPYVDIIGSGECTIINGNLISNTGPCSISNMVFNIPNFSSITLSSIINIENIIFNVINPPQTGINGGSAIFVDCTTSSNVDILMNNCLLDVQTTNPAGIYADFINAVGNGSTSPICNLSFVVTNSTFTNINNGNLGSLVPSVFALKNASNINTNIVFKDNIVNVGHVPIPNAYTLLYGAIGPSMRTCNILVDNVCHNVYNNITPFMLGNNGLLLVNLSSPQSGSNDILSISNCYINLLSGQFFNPNIDPVYSYLAPSSSDLYYIKLYNNTWNGIDHIPTTYSNSGSINPVTMVQYDKFGSIYGTGGLQLGTRSILTTNYNVSSSDTLLICTLPNTTIILPNPSPPNFIDKFRGKIIIIYNSAIGPIVVSPAAGTSILPPSSSPSTIQSGSCKIFMSNSNTWYTISSL